MGKAALDGRPGVITVLKAIRSSPFAEYNIVYYDPSATDAGTLLARLREQGCPNATQVKPREASGGGLTVRLESPVVVGGDWAWLTVKLPAGAPARLELRGPTGWRLPAGHTAWTLAGGGSVPVAVPSKALEADRTLELRLVREMSPTTLRVTATVVRRVP